MKLCRSDREQIARKRLVLVLERHVAALSRTLEQKISDAGPYGQRVDPHILTSVRNELVKKGRLVRVNHHGAPWFHLSDASPSLVAKRIDEQVTIFKALNHGSMSKRIGQTLEIATYRTFLETDAEFYGRFKDLSAHDDSMLYTKEEPPQHIGRFSLEGDQRLDFLQRHPQAGYLGIECKNVREWLYPDRSEITETLAKCVALNAIPVIIGRRIPYVTFLLLNACGVITHQTYNQLLPSADEALSEKARDKKLLGYHDIRTGSAPSDRLRLFITKNLQDVAVGARTKFENFKDLLADYSSGDMEYVEFAARVRRRVNGMPEDFDGSPPWLEDEPDPADWE